MKEVFQLEEITHQKNIPAKILLQRLSSRENYVPPHWHKHIEINLILEGDGAFWDNGKYIQVPSGDFIIINSEHIHSGQSVDRSKFIKSVTILWDYDFFTQYQPELYKYNFEKPQDEEIRQNIKDLLIKIAVLYRDQSPYYDMKVSSLLLDIGVILMENCLVPDAHAMDFDYNKKIKQIQDAILYIEKHYTERLTLDEISSEMNMAPTYFARKFKQYTSYTFYNFLMQYRVHQAQQDLLLSDDSVTEIAYNNGFPNVKSFIEQFKKTYQTTPKQYRKDKI